MKSNIIAFAIKAHSDTNHLYDNKPYSVHLAMVVYYAQKYIEFVSEEYRDDVISAIGRASEFKGCYTWLVTKSISSPIGRTPKNKRNL